LYSNIADFQLLGTTFGANISKEMDIYYKM